MSSKTALPADLREVILRALEEAIPCGASPLQALEIIERHIELMDGGDEC